MRPVSFMVIVAAPLLVAWMYWRRARRIEPYPSAAYHTHWLERIAGCGRTLHVQRTVSPAEAYTYEKSLQRRRRRFGTPPFSAMVSIHLWSPYSTPILPDSFLENVYTHLAALQWTAGPLGAVVELHYETSTFRARALLSSKPSDSSRTRLLPPCAA